MVDIHPKDPMAMCPMASMCKGIAAKPPSISILMIPGLVLIVIGFVIFFEPKVLIWLVATVAILLGVFLLTIAFWVRRMAIRFHHTHG